MTEDAVRRRTTGRSARVRQAVLDSALALILEMGADNVSIAAVSARAGVHETSIYRRWGTREKVMLDAILSLSAADLPVPDSGSLRGDLQELARELCAYMSKPLGLAVARLLSTPTDDPAIEETRARVWRERITAAGLVVERAVARGEAAPQTSPRFVIEMLVAPIHWRLLVLGEALEADMPEKLTAAVVDGIRPGDPPSQ